MRKAEEKLLEAKIQIPDEQKDYCRRNALLSEMGKTQEKLVVLYATIGYGKTVLLSQYVQKNNAVCAWYHLDALDNEVSTFIRYFVASVERAFSDFTFEAEMDLELRDTSVSVLFRELVLELNDYLNQRKEQKFIIVLDDFQVIENTEIYWLLEELLEYTGSQCRLFIATKSSIPDFLTKYVMRGQGKMINSQKLSFSREETYDVLERVLSKEEADAYTDIIWKNMEGWSAGVMFAALYIRQLGSQKSLISWEHICQESMAQEYIAYELFKRLPYDIQSFLLKTSFSEELHAELCNAVCGITNAGAILKYLLQENMFILHMGDRRGSYRYHSLFRSFLMNRAGENAGKEVYGTLAEYYMKHQNLRVAREYAHKAGNEELLLLLGEEEPQEEKKETKDGEKREKLLRVSCFGRFRVKRLSDGKELSWRTRKAMELFAYLVDLEGKPVERRVLIEHLWSDNMPNNAVAMLHNMIYSIRKELSGCPELENLIQYKNRQYYLDMSLLESDLPMKKRICDLAEHGQIDELLAYKEEAAHFWGTYLEEVEGEWCTARRAYFERADGKVCRLLAGYAEEEKDYEMAVRFWREYMETDRYSEEAIAGLLRVYGCLGERTQMKKVFEASKKLFLDELGLELGGEIAEAYEDGMKKLRSREKDKK